MVNTTPKPAPPVACVFDAYGTIFDVGSAVQRRAAVLGDAAPALTELWRTKQLQYTWLRSLQNQYVNFEVVTADALSFALESLNIRNDALRVELLALYRALDAYPDAVAALTQLRAAGMPSWILSNGTPAMLQAAVRAAGLESLIKGVLSVESAGVYKPHPNVYQLALEQLGVEARRIAFISANGWDAFAAAQFGLRAIWCNRSGQPRERLPGEPSRTLSSLEDLAAVVVSPGD
jgi:2-haloacid dehalogenase